MNDLEKKVLDTVTEVIEKSLPEVLDTVVDAKVKELSEKSVADMNEIKDAIKNLSIAQKMSQEGKELMAKTAMISIIKGVIRNNITDETAFKAFAAAEVKTMSESGSNVGDEFVFDQFEADVLRVINTYDLINAVKILPLAKGDKVSLPKTTNGITTAYVAETGAPSATDAATSFITINIYKAASLVNLTDDLMDDAMTIPDLYSLIVELIGESQASFIETQIISGTGSSAVEGILVGSGTNTTSLAATKTGVDITDANLVTLIMSVSKKYKTKSANVGFVMSQYTQGLLMQIKTTTGMYLYPELRDFQNPKLLGYKVIISDNMPVQAAGDDVALAKQIIFGDLTYFTFVRRRGMTVERGYYASNWAASIQSIKCTQRFGGKMTFAGAFAILKNGAAS